MEIGLADVLFLPPITDTNTGTTTAMYDRALRAVDIQADSFRASRGTLSRMWT